MTPKNFLKEFAKRYPKGIEDEKKFLTKTNNLYVDYADGVFGFGYRDPEDSDKYEYFGGGGKNTGDIFSDDEYIFLWEELIAPNGREFLNWIKDRSLSEDLMKVVAHIDLEKNLISEINCNFYFYN